MPKLLWQKGQSGNPAGRKPAPKLKMFLTDKDAAEILETVIQAAKSGDLAACKMLLDRSYPTLRPTDQTVDISLPPEPGKAAEAVLCAINEGQLTPDEARRLMASIADQVHIIEAAELTARIERLEEQARAETPDR